MHEIISSSATVMTFHEFSSSSFHLDFLHFSLSFSQISHKIFFLQNFHSRPTFGDENFASSSYFMVDTRNCHILDYFSDTPNQIKHLFFSFFYPLLSEPPEAKHVKRLSWIEIQTQTERNWGFFFLSDLENDFPPTRWCWSVFRVLSPLAQWHS